MACHIPNILRSETLWAAIQSIEAVLALVGLFFYTLYTRRMMELQLDTRRAEIAPEFTLSSLKGSSNVPPARNLQVRVRNLGKGPALRFRGWILPVDANFKLRPTKLTARRTEAEDGTSSNFEVLANEAAEMLFQRVDINRYLLCVLECEDTGGYKHQFQLIFIPKPAAMDPWQMVHGWKT